MIAIMVAMDCERAAIEEIIEDKKLSAVEISFTPWVRLKIRM